MEVDVVHNQQGCWVCWHEHFQLQLVLGELPVGLGFAPGCLVLVIVKMLCLLVCVLVKRLQDVYVAAVELKGPAIGQGEDKGREGHRDSISALLVVLPLVAA